VFVDQEEACECTRKRIDDSWAALQAAMKQSREVPVQRIHRDTQPVDVEPLSAKRKFVAVPAIFLLDGSGDVIDMLQGEVTDKEVATALR
jgi:thioredoxin-related protein